MNVGDFKEIYLHFNTINLNKPLHSKVATKDTFATEASLSITPVHCFLLMVVRACHTFAHLNQ